MFFFRYIPYILALNSTIVLFLRNLQTTVFLIINLAGKTETKKRSLIFFHEKGSVIKKSSIITINQIIHIRTVRS